MEEKRGDRENTRKISEMGYRGRKKYVGVYDKRSVTKRNVKRKGRIKSMEI